MPSDGADLLRRIAGGDRDAFAAFYDAYAPLAFGLIRRMLHSSAEAEEVLQEIFWEIWQSAADYDPKRGSPEAWVVMRARSRGIDRARSTPRRSEVIAPSPVREPAAAPEEPGRGPGVDADLAPPPQVKRALMDRITRARALRPVPPRFWPGLRWAASVAVAAGLLASVAAVFVSARYEARLGEMARAAAALREQATHQREALALLQDATTQVIALAGLDPSPGARGRMIWNEREGGIFVAAGLPPAPRGQAYELWAIVGARPIPAGLFTVDVAGRGSARVEALAGAPRVDQFAVTLEPAAGVPAPTGLMYLASK